VEFGRHAKELILQHLFKVVRQENNVEKWEIRNSYKSFVGGGNNSVLVKSVLKKR
jgi:hypothetical protein